MTARPTRSPARVLGLPLLLAALTLAGLVLGLTGDGVRDLVCVALLALPLVLFLVHWRRRARAPSSRKP
ncbi:MULTISPECIES: hypothetical protein [Novosphingobium]|uniref:hypothetical protein n=1 Tax=Novosphingobium TaxID=165696 RepID=UPI001CD34547|nr:hypothetical protein [Novosphingobium percolationis]MCH7630104.1 hypothetical protein [Pseudomonadota bacterium]